MIKKSTLLFSLLILLSFSCNNTEEVIYDEANVPNYKLPDLLVPVKGDTIKTFAAWNTKRREEILDLFAKNMYGTYPDIDYSIEFEERILDSAYLGNKAIVKEVEAKVTTVNGAGRFSILYIYPSDKENVPVFVGLNFGGNHTIDTLSEISLPSVWVPNNASRKISNNQATDSSRGSSTSRWPLKKIIENGFGLATVYYGDFDPDYDDNFENGFHPLFAEPGKARNSSSPGSITIWAKGMSLIADYLEQNSNADPDRIIAIGHSRLGKAALWSAVNDQRFSAVISNNSGCGGAALSMRSFGETVERINTVFPHWFCDEFNRYNGKERKLPMDQHMLLALMAPRPVYVASATEDQWADPMGEFLALKEASVVYDLYGIVQKFPETMPDPNIPYDGITGYHIRSGKHDLTEFDWIMYLNWSNKWLVQ